MRISNAVTYKAVRTLFDYDRKTGSLTWKVHRSSRVRAGDEAGTVQRDGDGKVRTIAVIVNRRRCQANRIIWLWMKGEDPPGPLTSRDGNHENLRWVNIVPVQEYLSTSKKDQYRRDRYKQMRTPAFADPEPAEPNQRSNPVKRDVQPEPGLVDLLREWFAYDENAGLLTWRHAPPHTRLQAGAEAGFIDSRGFVIVRFAGKSWTAQRLIWVLVTGLLPPGNIAFRNKDATDLRWRNIKLQDKKNQLKFYEQRKRMRAAYGLPREYDYGAKFLGDPHFDPKERSDAS